MESSSTPLLWSVNRQSIAVLLLLLCIVVYSSYVVWSYRRLQAFKGPFWASISPVWLGMHTMSGKLHLRLAEATREYGSLARISPNFLLTDDPAFLRRMSAARSPYTKGKSYDGMKLDPDAQNTLSEKNEKKHTAMRAKIANGYAGKDNQYLESSIDGHVLDLVHLIENHFLSINGAYRPMDLAKLAQYFTVDVLTDIAFSKPFNLLKHNDDIHSYIDTVRSSLPVLQIRANIPFVKTILESSFVRRILPTKAKDRFEMGSMMAVAKEAAAERFGPDAKIRNDMLGSFVRNGLTQPQLASEALLQIVVGVDSTATAVRTIMYQIMTNPRILTTLRTELDNAVLTRPILLDSEAQSLSYLQACITEGLRHWPPIAALTLKVVPPGGDTYNGQFIPGGTEIAYSGWALHHSKRIYGEDADIFRPERWLEAEGEKLREMKGAVDLVFGSGKYRCLGKKIAGLELNKVFAESFLRFDFVVVNPQKGFESRFHGLFMQSNMNVVAYPRQVIV